MIDISETITVTPIVFAVTDSATEREREKEGDRDWGGRGNVR